MADMIIIKDSKVVKKSNALARAKWLPRSVWESRIIAIIASQVKKDDKDFKEYKIPISVLLKMSDKSSAGTFYNDLRKIADQIVGRRIRIQETDGWTVYALFSKCRYRRKEESLTVRFDADLKPHFIELKSNYKSYPLIEFLALPSIYSQRVYEFLRSWDDCITTEIKIQDLHEMLCTPASMRRDFYNFRRRVLEKAYKDIHKYTKLKFEYETIKQGRKIVKIRFYMGKKTMQKVKTKQIKNDNLKRQKKDNKLFKQAIACAQKNKDKNNYCALKGTKKCCSACF